MNWSFRFTSHAAIIVSAGFKSQRESDKGFIINHSSLKRNSGFDYISFSLAVVLVVVPVFTGTFFVPQIPE
jgi:hypothetical protein